MQRGMKKKPPKAERELVLLMGLVDLYLKEGRPVGSNTLRKCGFQSLSSATIRNYFSKLEAQGYLMQQHSSGGRIPTPLAYKLYASNVLHEGHAPEKEAEALKKRLQQETREVADYLMMAANTLSEATDCAVFLSSPRFDHDFVLDVKIVSLDRERLLCAILTDFGKVHTAVVHTQHKWSNFTLKKVEGYFHYKLTHLDPPMLTKEEEELCHKLYNEVMLRHIASAAHFTTEDIYKTGFSKLLHENDINDPVAIASSLSLFENTPYLRSLLKECSKLKQMRCWIGDDLRTPTLTPCSVIAHPYSIHQTIVGALGILGPNRIPYKKLFALLHLAAEEISNTLTRSLYKFKISYRQPQQGPFDPIAEAGVLLLEKKQIGEHA